MHHVTRLIHAIAALGVAACGGAATPTATVPAKPAATAEAPSTTLANTLSATFDGKPFAAANAFIQNAGFDDAGSGQLDLIITADKTATCATARDIEPQFYFRKELTLGARFAPEDGFYASAAEGGGRGGAQRGTMVVAGPVASGKPVRVTLTDLANDEGEWSISGEIDATVCGD
jgi:hypothetical protein